MNIFMKFLPILMNILFTIPGLVNNAEVAFSGMPGKSGQAKKDLVMGSINAAAGIAGAFGVLTQKQQGLITDLTSVAVELVVTGVKEVKAAQGNWASVAGTPSEV